jgi:hypothetical protein
MASRGQSIVVTYVAWDTVNNVGKTGDVANHTLRWIKDGTAAAPTNAASEIDATNVPGVYKITLTTAECTCDSGTLAGKSSTANISIMPKDVTFEQLPTAAPGATNGLGILSATGAIPSNVTQINGSLTNGNNATLSLKKISVTNSDFGEYAIDISTTNAGGGGGPVRLVGTGGGNIGLQISAPYGVKVTSTSVGAPGVELVPGVSGFGLKSTIQGNITGNITGNVSGSVGSVSTLRPVKNVGYSNFMFPMFDASTKSPKAGLLVTAERAIDGNPFASCSNAVVELGNGVYRISLSADDMNGDKIMFRFTATGADDQLIEVFTQG